MGVRAWIIGTSLLLGCAHASGESDDLAYSQVGLTEHEAATLVRQRGEIVQRCYREGLSRNPELQGTVAVALQVDGKNQVAEAKLAEDELGDPRVGPCVARAVIGGQLPNDRRLPPGPLIVAFDLEPSGIVPMPPGSTQAHDFWQPHNAATVQVAYPKGSGPAPRPGPALP